VFRDFLAKTFGPARRAGRNRTHRFVPQLQHLEAREVPATFSVVPSGANGTTSFLTLQAAVDKAASASDGNDTININAGTYTGNTTVPSSANITNLVIQTTGQPSAEGSMAVLKANSGIILTLNGEAGVIVRSVKFDGTGTQANDAIFVENGATATIDKNFVRNFNPTTGEGIGIRVGRYQAGVIPGGTVTVCNNTVSNFADAGIVVTNGAAGTVFGNTVTGKGPNSATYHNGIEFSFGATGSIYSNTVTGAGKRSAATGSAGILLWKAGAGVVVGGADSSKGNTLQGNDLGISVVDGVNPTVKYNVVTGSYDYGIGFDSSDGVTTTVGATIANNNSNNVNGSQTFAPDGFYLSYLTGTAAAPITITNNVGNGNGGDGFYMLMSGMSGTITFNNNNANNNGLHGFELRNLTANLAGYGPVSIVQNNANANTGDGIHVENVRFTGTGTSSFTMGQNNTNSNLGNGIAIISSQGVVMDGKNGTGGSSNSNSNSLNGVLIQNSTNSGVKNYTIQSNLQDGIKVENSPSSVILSDTVGGSSANGNKGNGIEFFSQTRTYTYTAPDGSTQTYAFAGFSTGGLLQGNTVTYSSFNGIYFDANSTGNTVGGTGTNSGLINNTQANTFQNDNRANKPVYFDVNDQTGTSTTVANTYVKNTIGTKNKNISSIK
jgi:parallel beta-helix repeat protein